MSLQLLQVAVPAIWWEASHSPEPDFAGMVREALDIERRLPKGVDTGRDQRRYAASCASLETAATKRYDLVTSAEDFAACLAQNGLPGQRVGGDYLDWLAAQVEYAPDDHPEARLAASFFPPGLLRKHLATADKLAVQAQSPIPESVRQRLAFAHWAEQAGCGLVETAVFAAQSEASPLPAAARAQRIASPVLAIPSSAPPLLDERADKAQTQSEWAALQQEMS